MNYFESRFIRIASFLRCAIFNGFLSCKSCKPLDFSISAVMLLNVFIYLSQLFIAEKFI